MEAGATEAAPGLRFLPSPSSSSTVMGLLHKPMLERRSMRPLSGLAPQPAEVGRRSVSLRLDLTALELACRMSISINTRSYTQRETWKRIIWRRDHEYGKSKRGFARKPVGQDASSSEPQGLCGAEAGDSKGMHTHCSLEGEGQAVDACQPPIRGAV